MGKNGAKKWLETWICASSGQSLPVFRKAFNIPQRPASATIRICGLGQFELRCNGTKVGQDVLEPGWTNYRKTCLYVTHDLTHALVVGENVLGVMLGNGMYNVVGGRYAKFKGSFGSPKLVAQLTIGFQDGSEQVMESDASWRFADGPITFSCVYGGEDYDARLEQPGWDAPGFDASHWLPAEVTDGPGGELLAQECPPSRVMQRFTPVKVTEPKPGIRVYDLGQNFSGWPAITISGSAGARVQCRTGELLGEDGCVTQKRTGSPVWFAYTARGDGEATWHPRFSYTGFRFVQIEGDLSAVKNIEGQFVHSSARVVGKFECSNELLNRIHRLILAAMRSNTQSIFTDCPHREKLGWLEQTHLVGPGLLYNCELAKLYAKVSRDMRDAQHANGTVPTIAPQYTEFKPPWDVFNDSPEWGSAAVINPWLVYSFTGDRRLIDENYSSMAKYVAYLESRVNAEGILAYGLGDWYDIGDGDPGFAKLTSLGVTATAILYCDLQIMANAAVLLGKSENAERYSTKAAQLRVAFNAKWFDSVNHRYDNGSQCAQAVALALNLVEDGHRAAVLDQLVADIRRRGNHLTAGDVGFRFVLEALANAGRSDVVFDMLTQIDPPSYGAQLAAGATALTEAWDANPKSSQNHFMLGHAEEWFYKHLAGIQIDFSQAAEQIVISPAIVGDLEFAGASYQSTRGEIECRWERAGKCLTLSITIPPGSDAMVCVPSATGTAVGHIAESEGATAILVGAGEHHTLLRASPGRHRFESILV